MSNFGFWSENLGLFADLSVIARLNEWLSSPSELLCRSPSEQV